MGLKNHSIFLAFFRLTVSRELHPSPQPKLRLLLVPKPDQNSPARSSPLRGSTQPASSELTDHGGSSPANLWMQRHAEDLRVLAKWLWWRQDQGVELCRMGQRKVAGSRLRFVPNKQLSPFSTLPLTITEWHLKRMGRNNPRLNSEIGTYRPRATGKGKDKKDNQSHFQLKKFEHLQWLILYFLTTRGRGAAEVSYAAACTEVVCASGIRRSTG